LPNSLDPLSVSIRSLSHPNTALLEHSFSYSQSLPELFDRLIDHLIEVKLPPNPNSDANPISVRGRVVTHLPAENLLLLTNGTSSNAEQKWVKYTSFSEITIIPSDDQLLTPTIQLLFSPSESEHHLVELSYRCRNVKWESSYVGTLSAKENRLRLSGYFNIDNQSGRNWKNAGIVLMHPEEESPALGDSVSNAKLSSLATTTGWFSSSIKEGKFKQKRHIQKKERYFPITRKVDLPVGPKHVLFASATFPVKKVNLCRTGSHNSQLSANVPASSTCKIQTCLIFKNTSEIGLGFQLPAGGFLLNKRRDNAALGLLSVTDTQILSPVDPNDEVIIPIASIPITGHWNKAENYDQKKKILKENIDITLSNTSTASYKLLVEEFLSHHGDHLIVNCHPAHKPKNSEEPFKLRWVLTVKPNQTTKITYSVIYSNFVKE